VKCVVVMKVAIVVPSRRKAMCARVFNSGCPDRRESPRSPLRIKALARSLPEL